ncbi:placenta growth factor isoform X2 [Leopardus geoffroyi]|uniref:placenta growth factor isoform X2 n=1 Tax=Leopardus geoffroyi TaxID=46844 RepID=UPI001E264E7A|nr:placenta growth factor isoform X2 [Leopardus geoffroyi]
MAEREDDTILPYCPVGSTPPDIIPAPTTGARSFVFLCHWFLNVGSKPGVRAAPCLTSSTLQSLSSTHSAPARGSLRKRSRHRPYLPAPGWAGTARCAPPVVPFQEVWGRSYCRALERLVDIVSEYPSEVQHMFSPSCISLLRCTGCCGDENLHCVPVETVNVTMQLLKIHSEDRPSYVELTFSQHVRCECRPLREKMKPERRRPKGRGKRKREKQRPRDCHLCGNTVPRR